MAEQSPFFETTSSVEQKATAPSSSTSMGKMLLYGIIIVLIVFILWMLWNNSEAKESEGFIENTVRDDPAGDWDIYSEVAKLKTLQENTLKKMNFRG